ncbi:PREDICTED: phosphatidylinositol-glycan biosynthesis class X protein-like [Nicrophorus vespilloides]|uniref:Phosphatidylinositol-glycan biosynthesis class X protein n=1 Tax=Nicrophorus vespilloides TaxID=110193 RepID=A0ABM1NDR9_NICVS|nr:PREDICTED: phosphatidylinositol-glycan biosynthesis class X protein-like [Nicrophorus vespilloides]
MYKLLVLIVIFVGITVSESCFKLDASISQKIENEGFHRKILWLFELLAPKKEVWDESGCTLSLLFQANPGMYVYPDEIYDLNKKENVSIYVVGDVNIETPAHESTSHKAFVFIDNNNLGKISLQLPIHLRYQRAQITGGYGKVYLRRPTLLAKCPKDGIEICGNSKRINGPCNVSGVETCSWKNVTYQALFEDVELLVPIGDLDDYPIVAIFTLMLGCAGCIYMLSILSTASL